MGILEVADTRPALAFRQEEIPQPRFFRLHLETVHDFHLAVGQGPAIAIGTDLLEVFRGHRVDLFTHELVDLVAYRDQPFRDV